MNLEIFVNLCIIFFTGISIYALTQYSRSGLSESVVLLFLTILFASSSNIFIVEHPVITLIVDSIALCSTWQFLGRRELLRDRCLLSMGRKTRYSSGSGSGWLEESFISIIRNAGR